MKKILLSASAIVFIACQAIGQTNVGIGTNTPASKVDVKGNLTIGNTYSGTAAPSNGAIIEGRVGVGTSAPDNSAILDISAANKGVRFPNVTLTGVNDAATIASPVLGLVVWNTGTSWGSPALYINTSGTATPNWDKVSTSAGTLTNVTASSPLSSSGGTTPNISLTGVVPVGNGGTGLTAVGAGQVLIGTTAGGFLNTTLTGTGNQVNVTSASGSVTLSTPQDIATSSSPSFTAVAATGANQNDITSASSIKIGNNTNNGVAAGSIRYNGSTVQYSDGTNWSNVSSGGSVTSVATGTGLTGGPVTGSGTIALANTAVAPGSYSNANITVDQQGRITTASSGTAGTITGGGATNYMPKWTGATALSNSQVFDNGTSVGVGNPSPNYKLDVNGSFRTATGSLTLLNDFLYVSPTFGNTFNAGYSTNGLTDMWVNYRGYNDGITQFRNFNVGDGKGADVAWFDGPNHRMSINNGQLAAYPLDVVGDINSSTGYRVAGAAPAGNYLRGNGNQFVASPILAGDLPTSVTGVWTRTAPNVTLVNSADNVGLGVNPTTKLDINGTLLLRNGNVATAFTGSEQILFGYGGTTNYQHAIKTRHSSVASVGNSMDFFLWKFGTDAATAIGTQQVMTLDGGNGGSVGIGNTAPSDKLEVTGNVALSYGAARTIYSPDATGGNITGYDLTLRASGAQNQVTASSGGNLNLTAGNTNNAGGQAGGNVVLTVGRNYWNNGSNPGALHGDFVFNGGAPNTTSTIKELARLNGTTGNFGIGIPSPLYKLDVIGTGLFRNGNSSTTFTNDQILLGYAGANNYMHSIKSRHNSGAGAGNSIDFYVWKAGTDATTAVGTQQVMTLDGGNSGSVGIGTTTPGYKLDVNGSLRTAAGNLVLLNDYLYASPTFSNGFNSGYNSTGLADMWVNYHGYLDGVTQPRNFNVGDGKAGNIAWFDGVNHRMSINNGQVAGYPLDVVGDINSSTGYTIGGAATAGNYLRGNGTQFVASLLVAGDLPPTIAGAWTRTSPNVTLVTSTDNVGIGTSPNVKLDVSGSINANGNINSNWVDNTNYTQFPNAYTASPTYVMGFSVSTSGRRLFLDNKDGDTGPTDPAGGITLRTGATLTDRMHISYAGNVGIGNTAPLSVSGAKVLQIGTDVYAAGASDGQLVLSKNNASASGRSFKIGLNSTYGLSIGDFGFNGSATYTEWMNINYSNGFVGIGTSVPGDKLSVRSGALSFHHPTSDVPYVGIDYDVTTDALRFRANVGTAALNTTDMTILRTTGNVGIGNTAPIGPLAVGNSALSGSDGFIVIGKNNGGGGTRHERMGFDAGFNFVIGDYGGSNTAGTWVNAFSLNYAAPANTIYANSSGNVGIGTASPGSKLDVNGKITATQLQVTNLPAFCADMNAPQAVSTNAFVEIKGWRTSGTAGLFNSNSNFDNTSGRFTAPRNGYYFFSAQIRLDGISSSGGYARIDIAINGAPEFNNGMHAIANDNTLVDRYQTLQVSGVVKLAAGDYVSVWTLSAVDASYTIQDESGFTGYEVSDY